jgi:hypothetical protein
MKRLLLALSLALLVSIYLSVSVASASHTNGGGPNKDLVVGSTNETLRLTESDTGILVTINIQVHVNAQSGPAGENARGHFVVRFERNGGSRPIEIDEIDATGKITCLAVRENRTLLLGPVGRNKGEDSLRFFALFVDDNGEGKEPNDKALVAFFPGDPGPDPFDEELCRRAPDILDDPLGPKPGLVIKKGNFTVHDATP